MQPILRINSGLKSSRLLSFGVRILCAIYTSSVTCSSRDVVTKLKIGKRSAIPWLRATS